MEQTPSQAADPKLLRNSVDVFVHLSLIAILTIWCFRIFEPFLIPVMWGIIIAVALFPLFGRLTRLLGGRNGLAGVVFTVVALAAILYPTYRISDSFVHSVLDFQAQVDAGTVTVPPPSPSVADWPVIGEQTYALWSQASSNLDATLARLEPQIRELSRNALGWIGSIGKGILQTIFALIIAGFAMAHAEGGRERAHRVSRRIGGERGGALADLATGTIRSVAQGVVGIALVQSFLGGLGMALVGVPGWGVWTILILILAVVQLPPLLIMGPAAVYVFSTDAGTTVAVLFAIWAIIVSISDVFLKPLFLGRGMDIPMPVILIGAIGGVILSGIIGLFVGAVVLAIGYQLFQAWLESGAPLDSSEAGEEEGQPV